MSDTQVAVVTGAGAHGDGIGNGRATAMVLADAGHEVVVVDRKEAEGARTVELIADRGGQAHLFVADVTNEDSCQELAEFTKATCGIATMLVNNVGIGARGDVLTTQPDVWTKVMQVNVDSIYHVSRQFIPDMVAGDGGSIVNIGSIASNRPHGLTVYSASKGAVVSLTQAMAVDHGRDGVRVNAVLPGPVWTPLIEQAGADEVLREKRRRASLLGVEGTAWDVANAVAFLLSSNAQWITGEALVVDGGTSLRSAGR